MFNEIFVDIGVLTKFKIILPDCDFFFSVNKINLSKSEQQHNLTMVLNIYFLIQFVRGKKNPSVSKTLSKKIMQSIFGIEELICLEKCVKIF